MVARNALRAVVSAALVMCVSIMDARVVTRSLAETTPPIASASVSTSTESNKPKETSPKESESYTLAKLNGPSDASRVKPFISNDEKNNSGDQSGSKVTRKTRSEIIASLTKGEEAKSRSSVSSTKGEEAKSRSSVSSRDIKSKTSASFDHRSGASSRDDTESSATSKTEKSSGRRSTEGRRESEREDDDDDDEEKDASTKLTDAQRKAAKEARHKAQLERKAKRQAQKEEWRKIKEQQRAEHEAAKKRARSETSAIQEAAGVTRNLTVTKEQE